MTTMAPRGDKSKREAAIDRLAPWVERGRRFSGWDFAHLGVRPLGPRPAWDYVEMVRERGTGCRKVLDLGTGGGELLASLRDELPAMVVATEEWDRNAPIAFRRFSQLGVHLVHAKSLRLPFANATFDLVIDRHEEFDPEEVARVLVAGGTFVTQQVGRHDWKELRGHVPRMTDFADLQVEYTKALTLLGWEVQSREWDQRVAYPSLGEFVFMLAVAPWTIPDFELMRDLDALLAFESDHTTEDGLVVTECRFLVVGRKPR